MIADLVAKTTRLLAIAHRLMRVLASICLDWLGLSSPKEFADPVMVAMSATLIHLLR